MLIPGLIPSAYILNKDCSPWAVVIMCVIRMLIALVLPLPRNVCVSGHRCAMHTCKSLHVVRKQLHSQALPSLEVYWFHIQQNIAVTEGPKIASEARPVQWRFKKIGTKMLSSLLMRCHKWVWHWMVFTCLVWQVSYRCLICWTFTSSGVPFTCRSLH